MGSSEGHEIPVEYAGAASPPLDTFLEYTWTWHFPSVYLKDVTLDLKKMVPWSIKFKELIIHLVSFIMLI